VGKKQRQATQSKRLLMPVRFFTAGEEYSNYLVHIKVNWL